MRKNKTKIDVTFGEGVALIRRQGHTAPIVASVLGREQNGIREIVHLDRLVHEDSYDWGEWNAFGAVSTILERSLPPEKVM